MMSKFSIFGDGDNIIIFSKEGKCEFAYTFENPAIMEIGIDQDNDIGELAPTMGGKVWIPKPQPNTKFTIRGMSLAENTTIQSSEEGALIPKLSIFKNITVSELFLVINRKLTKRAVGKDHTK